MPAPRRLAMRATSRPSAVLPVFEVESQQPGYFPKKLPRPPPLGEQTTKWTVAPQGRPKVYARAGVSSGTGGPRRPCGVSLDFQDRVRSGELLFQPRHLRLELAHLGTEGVVLGRFRAALLRRQTLERAVTPRLAPSGQVRGVQALTAKQPSDLARTRTSVRLLHDPQPILGGELAPGRLGYDLRGPEPAGVDRLRPWGSRRYAPRPPGPALQPPSRSSGLSLFSSVLTSTPYTNSRGCQCLRHVGREGCAKPKRPTGEGHAPIPMDGAVWEGGRI